MNVRWMAVMMAAVVLTGDGLVYAQAYGGGGRQDRAPADMKPAERAPRGPMGRPGPGGCPNLMPEADALREAGASDEQIRTIEALRFEEQGKRIDRRAAVEKAEWELNRRMRAADADEASVMSAVEALNQARGESFKADVAFQLKMKHVLGEKIRSSLCRPGSPDCPCRKAPGRARPDRPMPDNEPPARSDQAE